MLRIYFYIIICILKKIYFYFPGGPTKCGDKEDLPQNYTCSKDDEISGNVTLCGKPQPTMSWMVGDQSFNGTVDLNKADQHQYTYSFKGKVTSDMCGKNISYQATGFQNKMVTGSSFILMRKCKCSLFFKYFENEPNN